jgi:hypothetical protein
MLVYFQADGPLLANATPASEIKDRNGESTFCLQVMNLLRDEHYQGDSFKSWNLVCVADMDYLQWKTNLVGETMILPGKSEPVMPS